MRRTTLGPLLLLAACSKSIPNEADPAADRQASGSLVGVTTMPGVALTYAYTFRLPTARVTAAQEAHAAACEALGPEKCRIVGMSYRANPDRTISAGLGLKLAPPLARGFGKAATDMVVKDGGMLTEASIDSIEAGAAARRAQDEGTSLSSEEDKLQDQLTSRTLPSNERTELQRRLAGLRDAARAARADAAGASALLASTPMTITYQSGAVDPGFSDGPLLGAVKDGWANIVAGFATILLIVITLLPWLLAIAVAAFLVTRLRGPLARLFGVKPDGA